MVYHLTGHAAVDTDVLACDEARLVGTEIEHHVCNIQGITHTPDWLLHGIGTLVNGIGGVNPTGRNAVHAYLARQTYGKSMCQCGNASLCSRVTSLLLGISVGRILVHGDGDSEFHHLVQVVHGMFHILRTGTV